MSIEPIRRQSLVSLVWQIAFTLIGFLSTMYFTRTVGAGILGAYFLFLSYFSIINLFADNGFGNAAIKRISEGEEQDAFFSAYTAVRLILMLVIIALLVIFRSYFVDINNAGTFFWLLVAIFVSPWCGIASSSITGCGKVGVEATSSFLGNTSRVVLQVIAVYLGYGVAGLTGGFVGGMIIGFLVQLRFINLRYVRFSIKHLKSLFSFSLWSFLVSGGSMIFMHSDTMMIGYYLGDADVGLYRVIFQFTSLSTFTTGSLLSTLWPRVSRWSKTDKYGSIGESLSKALTYSFILAIPLYVGGALLGDKLLYFFYGEGFVSYSTLMLLFTVQIATIFQNFYTSYLSAMDKLKDVFKVTITSAIVNISLNALLIPSFGIQGAAIATIITMALNAFLARNVLTQIITTKLERDRLLIICKASLAMGIFVGAYRYYVILSSIESVLVPIIIGGVIYVLFMFSHDKVLYMELKGLCSK